MALCLPVFVMMYNKREWLGHLFAFSVLLGTSIWCGHVCVKYQLRAGPFAEENWYLFAYLFQKPQFKLMSTSIGVFCAFIYMKILSFRRIPDEETRKQRHPLINKITRSDLIHTIMFLLGFGIILMNLLVGHQAIADPYSWTTAGNVAYFTIGRVSYPVGIWIILFVFFTGGFTMGKTFLGRAGFRIMGKICFEAALITPMMVQLIYSQLPEGVFI